MCLGKGTEMVRWALFLLVGCQTAVDTVDIPTNNVMVVATAADDFSTGALSVVSLDDAQVYGPITAVSGDPVVQVNDGSVVQILSLIHI